jgi:glycine/D-amino acid oxidase-like deaminating enzyme
VAADLPKRARVVIVGGGVIGCSIAYHLTKIGWDDVILLERKQLTSGTTWHAAGLVGQLRPSINMTKLAKYTGELYRGLEAETGQATGYRQCGSVSMAANIERFEELKRSASMAKVFDLPVDVITPDRIKELFPIANVDDIVGGIHIPSDGYANAVDITQALAKGARAGGARIFENTKVTRIRHDGERVTGVETAQGHIDADIVVLCGGMWTRDLAASIGVAAPLHACEHYYVLFEGIEGLTPDLPVLRDYDYCGYYKYDAGKLLVGAFEPNARPWGVDGISEDFCFDEIAGSFEHFEPVLLDAMRRVPALENAGIQKFFCGPESFTPDVRYHLGESPELKGCFVAAGLNSIGLQSAGGVLIFAAICRSRLTGNICANGSAKALAFFTPPTGRSGNMKRHAVCAGRRSTTGRRQQALATARRMDGNGQIGMERPAATPNMNIAMAARIGSMPVPRNVGPHAKQWRFSINHHLPNSVWKAATQCGCLTVFAPMMLMSCRVSSFIRSG